MTLRRRLVTALACTLSLGVLAPGLAGCTGPTSVPGEPWPTTRGPGPEGIPEVRLSYDFADDLTTVTGTELVSFVPDRSVCEVVFRAWPNKPATAESGSSLRVGRVRVGGADVEYRVLAAGAPDGVPGTLVEGRLPRCVQPGTRIDAALDFTLTLGANADERMGVDPVNEIAWLGTAFPLLAWQRGVGWVRDDAEAVSGEMATSETFDLKSLEVDAPSRYAVAGVGTATETLDGRRTGRTLHVFTAPAMRDVAVTVGRIAITDAEAAGTRIHLVTPEESDGDRIGELREAVTDSLTRLRGLLGPVPYDDLWISFLPPVSEGVELTGAVQLAEIRPREDFWLVTHELAHQWFYGLVGNNQAKDPWLDESLASYVQEVVAPEGLGRARRAAEGRLGAPMSYFAERRRSVDVYVDTVYTYGAGVLIDIRRSAGADVMDEAVRGYLRDNAHRIAAPADLRTALADVPGADEALADAGAWDG